MEQHKDLEIPMKEIASNTFQKENYLGGGGFGPVFKGELSRFKERGLVAFKKLNRIYGQGETEFFKEIEMLSKYKHDNIITLLGYCMEGKELILVYEYACNGSLDSCLNFPHLTWTIRLKICLQAAKGLSYLHDPNESHVRVIHRDIKSANILLDDKWNAKVSDFGLSKITPENANNVTYATGTSGYSDPHYHKTFTLTEKSDVYSFGVTLFEVLCGRLCYDVTGNNELLVYVHKWMKSYEENKLEEIVFKELDMKQIDPSSIQLFSDIAYKCLNEFREERPTMAEVVSQLEIALQAQEHYDMMLSIPLPKEYEEILRNAVSPVIYTSIEELKQCLSQWILINEGRTYISLNEMGAHDLRVSIEDCYMQRIDKPDKCDYDNPWGEESARFIARCYKSHYMNFKLHIKSTALLTPDVTYRVSLLFRVATRDNRWNEGVRYQLHGETKITTARCLPDDEELWGAELYQFTNRKESFQELEILVDDSGFVGSVYVEGIEFRSMKKVETPAKVADKEIVRNLVHPLFYNYDQEFKLLLSQKGVLIKEGRMWLSLNENEALIVCTSIEVYIKRYPSDNYRHLSNTRFKAAYYKTRLMKFKLHVTTPLFLSPDVRYGLNLLIYYSEIEKIKDYNIGIRYTIQGETKMSTLQFQDKERGHNLVAEFYQFTNYQDSILDLEILFENCGLSGMFYVEGIDFRPLKKAETAVVIANEEIVRAAVPPMIYESTKQLERLLSQGILFNEGKTMVSINDKGQNIERIQIEACLDGSSQFPSDNSRFSFYDYKDEFKASVRAEYLSPQVSYTLNICFQYKFEEEAKEYTTLRYKLDGDETKVFITGPEHMTEKGWFLAPLYQFRSQCTTLHLDIMFEKRITELRVAAIQLNPSEERVDLEMFEEYEDILKAASQPLVYRSIEELFEIFLKGLHLNGHKTWFSINKNGEHSETISMKDCLIPNENYSDRFKSHPLSRFPTGLFETNGEAFKTHVKTRFLSPLIKYTIYLVFTSSSMTKQAYVVLKYRLRGDTISFNLYLANMREEDGLHMAELFQFTSNGSIFDLEIEFDDHQDYLGIEGILFQPLEKIKDQNLEDSHSDSNSDSDTYWEQKIPNDYEEILRLSKDRVRWTTKEELYSIFCRGLLLDKGQQLLTIDKSGMKCLMLCARISLVCDKRSSTWESLPQSRFGEVLVITADDKFKIWSRLASQDVSPGTRYACYLVYRLPLDQSTLEAPLCVNINNGHDWDAWFVYLISPPKSPVIGQNLDENTCNPSNRYKGDVIPQQRSDGWMEVKVWEFQTKDTKKTTYIHLKLTHPKKKDLSGLMLQGIELRPI